MNVNNENLGKYTIWVAIIAAFASVIVAFISISPNLLLIKNKTSLYQDTIKTALRDSEKENLKNTKKQKDEIDSGNTKTYSNAQMYKPTQKTIFGTVSYDGKIVGNAKVVIQGFGETLTDKNGYFQIVNYNSTICEGDNLDIVFWHPNIDTQRVNYPCYGTSVKLNF